ncbi:MAG: SMP-30/gluconolactonase/LRE family protein [Gammaproteobacteria bacterium]
MNKPEQIVDGLGAGEGPVWCDDGTVVVTSVDQGVLYRVWPAEGRKVLLARTGGGPNGATPAAGGGFIVTQNGGFDFRMFGLQIAAPDRVEPGLQSVTAGGAVTYLVAGGFNSPNDLVVDAAGTLYFTDPQRYPHEPGDRGGRIWSLRPGAQPQLFAQDFAYCNGIGLDGSGQVILIEDEGLSLAVPGRPREWVIERLGSPGDGFCRDRDGRFYVCLPGLHGVRVVEDGRAVDFLEVPFDPAPQFGREPLGWVTNCCFGGPDMRTLFVTTGFPGRLVAFEHMPAPGAVVHPWRGVAG